MTLTILWNVARPVKIFPGIFVRQNRTDRKQMGLLKEQFAELRRELLQYLCNQVWTKNGGRIQWNVDAICETFKISCLKGRHCFKGGSEYHSTAQLYRLEQWSNITLFLQKTYRDCINLVLMSCQENSSVMYYMQGRIWKGDMIIADIEELDEMDASELYARRPHAKEVLTPMKGDNFIFPVADGTVKIS